MWVESGDDGLKYVVDESILLPPVSSKHDAILRERCDHTKDNYGNDKCWIFRVGFEDEYSLMQTAISHIFMHFLQLD